MNQATANLVPKRLRCEYLENPLGIDVIRPRLSWIVNSDKRGQRQTAYHVLVSRSEVQLAAGKGDLWDTGKVETDETADIVYAGNRLESCLSCHWKVRVWDLNGTASGWSHTAKWSMGLLRPSDWQAKWLGYTRASDREADQIDPAQALTFDGCQWIWFPEVNQRYLGDDEAKVPLCTRYFRRTFTLPEQTKVQWAGLVLAVFDEFVLYVNGEQVGEGCGKPDLSEPAYTCELTKYFVPGQNVLAVEATHATPSLAGVTGKLIIQMRSGNEIVVTTDGSCGRRQGLRTIQEQMPGSWRVSNEKTDGWTKAGFNDSDWATAQPLVDVDSAPGRILPGWRQESPSPVFRKIFVLNKPVKSASVYVCGLGYYELRLNGSKVDEHVLDPAFTVYDRRVLYATYDVTDRLRQGRNALGVMLGNGWYNMHTRTFWGFDRESWRGRPKMLLELRIVPTPSRVFEKAACLPGKWRGCSSSAWTAATRCSKQAQGSIDSYPSCPGCQSVPRREFIRVRDFRSKGE